MPASPLFLHKAPRIRPAPDRDEPTVWIRRLVLVDDLGPKGRTIQDVPFRRGLNIVCTEKRKPQDGSPIGHSVGKTLLLRIIRYCLGETRYCSDEVRAAVANKLPHAYALAEIHVGGQSWAVARPLGLESGASCSWCRQTNNLDQVRVQNDDCQKFSHFLDAINDATKGCFTRMVLPNAERPAEWKDLLGWLSRDQDCRYIYHNVWRVLESQAGPRVLEKEDAHLVMMMALGLFEDKDIDLQEKHAKLLRRKADVEAQIGQWHSYLDRIEENLRVQAPDTKDSPSGETFGAALMNLADQKQKSLGALLKEIEAEVHSLALQTKRDQTVKALGAAESRLEKLRSEKATVDDNLEKGRKASAATFAASFAQCLWKCYYSFPTKEDAKTAGCPGTEPAVRPGQTTSPAQQAWIEDQAQFSLSLASDTEKAEAEVEQLKKVAEQAKEDYSKNVSDQLKRVGQVREEIGSWGSLSVQAEQFRTGWQTANRLEISQPGIAKRIAQSLKAQETARQRLGPRYAELSLHFETVLRAIVSDKAGGSIQVDGNGIRPVTNAAVASAGATLKTYARVLGFDLACLIASITGVGHLPRLWMHDCPREADSEEALYHRLLHFVAWLESQHDGREPSFQYLLTTTTPPPDDLNKAPYVCLTLSARRDQDRLLGKSFNAME